MEKKLGRSVVDDLETIASQPLKKWTRDELEAIKSYYKDKINDLERGIFPETSYDTGLSMSAVFSDLSEADGLPDGTY